MGLRVRLKASFDIRPFPRQARIVLTALKRYGMFVADNGSNWYISGAPIPAGRTTSCTRWQGHRLDFEVVDTSKPQALARIVAVEVPVAARRGQPAAAFASAASRNG